MMIIIIKKYWIYILFAISVVIFLITTFKKTKNQQQVFELKTIKVSTGFGYEINKNNNSFIKQTVIPAVEGDKVFATEAEAEKTGKLVIYKLEHDQMPSISINELDSLNITK